MQSVFCVFPSNSSVCITLMYVITKNTSYKDYNDSFKRFLDNNK